MNYHGQKNLKVQRENKIKLTLTRTIKLIGLSHFLQLVPALKTDS